MPHTLTLPEVRALVTITRAVDSRSNSKIIWASGTGYPVTSVVRNFTDERGNFLHHTDDVLAARLWASGTLEHFIPVREVIEELIAGRMHILNGDDDR